MSKNTDNTVDELSRFLNEHPDTRYIDAIFVDLCGIVRGKRIPREESEKIYDSGVQIPHSVYLLDVTGYNANPCGRGFGDGDPDGVGMPVPGTLAVVPWAQQPSGQVLMTLANGDGSPSIVDPRNVAARVLRRFAELGLRPVIAFELEFYLLDRERDDNNRPQAPVCPITGQRETATQVYSISELDTRAAFLDDVVASCKTLGVPASVATAEFAPAQYEINLHHVESPLVAADHCALLRHAIKSIATRHGLAATFMAKPFDDLTGNGMHLHLSLVDADGRNVFDDGTATGSAQLHHAIGGLQAAMAESFAVFAPNVNAFRRFAPNLYVPVTKDWGVNNRSVAFRIPAGPSNARRIEHRVAGADANPYLVLAAILAGVDHGLINQLDPGAPAIGNACAQADADLPLQWHEALQRLELGSILNDYIGREYLEIYGAAKQAEMARFNQYTSAREYDWYL
jgi:glutamine synthetase